jgi:hypothetical protein
MRIPTVHGILAEQQTGRNSTLAAEYKPISGAAFHSKAANNSKNFIPKQVGQERLICWHPNQESRL